MKKQCQVDGCERPMRARGYCSTHYSRFWKKGDAGSAVILPVEERKSTRQRFEENATIKGPNECWPWNGARNQRGLPQIVDGGDRIGAHRWSWEDLSGEPLEGRALRRLCETVGCVNPQHYELKRKPQGQKP